MHGTCTGRVSCSVVPTDNRKCAIKGHTSDQFEVKNNDEVITFTTGSDWDRFTCDGHTRDEQNEAINLHRLNELKTLQFEGGITINIK